MSDIVVYQNIEFDSIFDFEKDYEIIEYEKKEIERWLIRYQIEYVLKVLQSEVPSSILPNTKVTKYTLTLIVKKEDVPRVLEILENESELVDYFDFSEISKKIENSNNDSFREKGEYQTDDINSQNNDEDILTDEEVIKSNNDAGKGFVSSLFKIIFNCMYLVEFVFMYRFYKIGNYEMLIAIIVIASAQFVFSKLFSMALKKKKDKVEYL